MTQPIVATHDITRHYEQGDTTVKALDGVSICVEHGEFVSLAGPSGSGKSTLLNIIGGLDRPTSGTLCVADTQLNELNNAALADLRLHRIGFVFQAYNLIPVLTARENVEFIMQMQGVAANERRQIAQQTLAELGMSALADRRPNDMSGGQQQRVAVARAIASKPELLLADEPSANLDSKTTDELLSLLSQINEQHGITIITATHDPAVMARARRHIQLRDGRIEQDDNSGTT